MSVYSRFVKHVTFPPIVARDGLKGLVPQLRDARIRATWTPSRLREYQITKIRALLIHAYQHTRFYRNRFDAAAFAPDTFADLEDLRRIPPLTRNDLIESCDDLVATNYKPSQLHRAATGGSTGVRTVFYRDNSCLTVKKAIEYRCNISTGWDIGERIAYYWPAIQDYSPHPPLRTRIKNSLSYRQLFLFAGRLSDASLDEHYAALSSFRPRMMRAFPNALSHLAEYIIGADMKPLCIPSVVTVGEPLMPSHIDLFRRAFACKVYNCYVSRECGNMACQCGHGDVLHINADMVHIEFGEGDAQGDAPQSLLITDFTNYGMPFIRYLIGDMGRAAEIPHTCGCGLPAMTMDAGRVSDFLVSPVDGALVSGSSLLHHLLATGPVVGQVQVVQDRVDHLVIRVGLGSALSNAASEHIGTTIKTVFGGAMGYDVEYVEHIPHEPSGKYMFTKCLLRDE